MSSMFSKKTSTDDPETKNDRAESSPEVRDNLWPDCGSINVKNAEESIGRIMEEWKSIPGLNEWMYNVEFVSLKADQSSDFFLYEVKWSVPTPEYPIPQVTVGVFFSIEASRVMPKTHPVDVTYVFEGTQFVHRLDIPFRQKWLYDILDTKTLMFRSFRF